MSFESRISVAPNRMSICGPSEVEEEMAQEVPADLSSIEVEKKGKQEEAGGEETKS